MVQAFVLSFSSPAYDEPQQEVPGQPDHRQEGVDDAEGHVHRGGGGGEPEGEIGVKAMEYSTQHDDPVFDCPIPAVFGPRIISLSLEIHS